MIIITTALTSEARPLIEAFSLKQFHSLRNIRFYQNDDILLAITGTGSLSAAVGLTAAAQLCKYEPEALINIGVAGCGGDIEIGALRQVYSVRDAASAKFYYPDILLNSGLPIASLDTHATPVDDVKVLKSDLVDMEGAGFFHAAQYITDPSRIQLLKVVSDHLTFANITADFLTGLIHLNIDAITGFITLYQNQISGKQVFTVDAHNWLQSSADILKLTTTQQRELKQLLTYFLIRGASGLPQLPSESPKHKNERSRLFNELKATLSY